MAIATAVAFAASAGAAACDGASEGGVPDEALGGLVHAEASGPPPIDVDRAATDPGELARALAMPHRLVSAGLGPHLFAGTSSVETREGSAVVDTLADTTAIELDGDGSFHAALSNSKDYGREAFFVGGMLYLRPRWGKLHGRPPTDPLEPLQIRDDVFATLGAYFELVAAGAQVHDRGAVQHGGRAARAIAFDLAAAPRPVGDTSTRATTAWRTGVTVRAVTGQVILDAVSGAPLDGQLDGTFAFQRDGRSFEMRVQVSHAIRGIGEPHPIAAPPPADVVATPEREREVEERDALLKGLAPPTKKASAAASAAASAPAASVPPAPRRRPSKAP